MRSFFRAVIAFTVVALAVPALAQDRVKSKEIVIGLGAEPRTMLAVTIVDWTTNNMLEHIYDRLLDRDPKTFKPVPMLATGFKIVNDTTWEFTLRKGVKFHNGEPFTAQSVKATLEYALDPASKSHYATASYWGPLKEVQVVDDYTVRFLTKQPWPNLIDHAGQGAQGAGAGEAGREADRDRAVQVRRVASRRAAGARAQYRLLGWPGRREPRDVPVHP